MLILADTSHSTVVLEKWPSASQCSVLRSKATCLRLYLISVADLESEHADSQDLCLLLGQRKQAFLHGHT